MKHLLLFVSICAVHVVVAQKSKLKGEAEKEKIIHDLDAQYNDYKNIAHRIWEFAEVGYKEAKSSALLIETLEKAGFTVEKGVSGIPTAFVATWGAGKPVVGILAEYDALPGLSQQAVPEKVAVPSRDSGHGCGHHLFGTASVAAAIALKKQLEASGKPATVKVFGTPAEEGGSGKVYMVRDGLFKNVDVVLHWHPDSRNNANTNSSLANITAKFRFHGISAHAAAAPEQGRSALDGVEAMNNMVNMMREHVPSDARIHYIITEGGKAPNVVPDYAEVYYYARHNDRTVVADIFSRIVNAAKGAAMGTGTTVDYEIIGGVYDLLPVEALARVMHRNLTLVGGVAYTPEEIEFGKKIQATLIGPTPPLINSAAQVDPISTESRRGGSTDVGDVSWAVPTVGLRAATWIPGTPAHSWQAVACGGTDIGHKGMMVAAKTMALTGWELINNPSEIEAGTAEWKKLVGPDFQYKALLGDREPALNYRD